MRGFLLLLLVGATLVGGAIGCAGGNLIQSATPLGSHVVEVVAKVSGASSGGSSTTQTANFTLTVIQ